MAPRKSIAQKEPPLAPERALKALRQQLEALQKLKNRNYQEAGAEETEWWSFTGNIIEAAFGNPSVNLTQFHLARNAGKQAKTHFIDFITFPEELQARFESRIQVYGALLRSLVKTLELRLPENETQGVYEPSDEYAFYRDLSSLVVTARKEIFIVDAYLNEEVFDLYVSKIPDATAVHILSNKIGSTVETVARKYAKSRPLELRSSRSIHDRLIFLDQRGWVIGQSMKDAAKEKPTYLIELNEFLLTAARGIHNRIWEQATVVI